jgi:hypothetical protein
MLYLVRHCQTSGQEPAAPLTRLGQQQLSNPDLFGVRYQPAERGSDARWAATRLWES